MRNNFSLLTHKGRWLLATLTILFTMGIGQMWGEDVTLFSTNFKEAGWGSLNNTETAQTLTIGSQTVYVRANNTGNLLSVNTTSGTLTWGNRNFSNKDCYLAIPVTNVNGSLTITVANGASSTRFQYAVVAGSTIANPSSTTSSTAGAPSVYTASSLTGTSYVVYLGRQGSGATQATSITITTPAAGTKSSEKKLLSLKFDNGFDAFIKESNHTVTAYYLSGTSAPTISSHTESAKASYAISGNTITITAEDETTQDYTLTLTSVTPYAGTGSSESFTGEETYIKTGYTYESSTSSWRFSKNAEDGRIQEGKTRLYFFVGACQELKLTSCVDSRNMKVYRNGTELATPTASGSSGTTITIAGSEEPAIYGLVSNQTGGDAKFNAIQIVPISATPVDPTFVYTAATYTIGDPALDLSTKLTSDSEGAITFAVSTSDAGTTGASIANGKNFTATDAGTATITVSQEAATGYNAKTQDITVTVQAAPEEKAGIKMIETGALTGNFRIKADQLKTGSYTVDGIAYTKYVQMGSTHTSFSGETEGNQAKGIYYAPQKKNIRFWFYMRNTDTATRKIYVYTAEEGQTISSATVDVETGSQLVYKDITLNKNAEIVFGVENTKLFFCQIVAVETGDALLQGGQIGYVFDYSKKRQNVAQATLRTIDGIDYYLSAESKINSAGNVQLTTLGTHYLKFHLDARTKVKLTIDGTGKQYYIGTEKSTADAAKLYSGTATAEFNLNAGDWYVNGGGVQTKITKLEFLEPDAVYAVTYSAGAGSVKEGQSLPTQEATVEGGKFNTALGTALEKSGYDFAGWQWTDDESNTHDIAANTEFTMPAYPVTFVAQWTLHVDKYTVKYMDGEDLLDSEEVTVGEHPVGIANPTKPLFVFANWKNGDDVVNPTELDGTADQVITLQAQWTKAYVPQGASYVFENTATVGTTYSITVTKDNQPNAIAADSRIDNMWLSAMSVKLEDGTYSGSGDDFKGWKINTASATIRFYVENDSRVTVTVGNLSSGLNITYTAKNATEATTTALTAKAANQYDVKGGSLVTLTTGGGSTVTLKGIAVSAIPALDDDATLSDLKVGGVTVAGFAAGIHTYYYELPYGTPAADIPEISATANSAKAKQVAIEQAVWTGEPYNCYRAQANVQAEDESWGYYDVQFTFAPKYGVELIKATHDGTASGATITGYIGGQKDKDTYANGKLGEIGKYFGIKLAEGNFQAGDLVEVKVSMFEGGNTATMFTDKGETPLSSGAFDMNNKVYRFTLTAETEWIYIYRKDGTCNPRVQSIAVYRLMPAFIEEFAISGVEDFVIDQENKAITASVANTFDVTALTPTVKYWGNGGGAIDKTEVQNFTNPVTYTVSSAYAEDATGDYAPVTYTVTITQVTPSVAPTITTQPAGANYVEGASIAALTVEAESTAGELSYQWQVKNGLVYDDIEGATAATYAPAISAIGSYTYRVVVTNTEESKPATSVNSNDATIVIAADPACATFAAASIPTAEPYQYTNTGEWTIYNASSSGKRNGADQVFGNVKDFEGNDVKGFAKERCVLIFEKDMKQVRFYSANAQRAWGDTPVRVSDDAETFLGTGTPSYSEYAATTSIIQADPSNNKEQIFIANGEFLAGKCYWFAFSGSLQIFQICAVEADPLADAPVFSGALSDEAICPGNNFATLDATASPVTSYAWFKDNEVIAGATAATYTPTAAGTYYCIATNSAVGYRDNSTKSAEAVLSVKEATSVTMSDISGKAAASIALNAVATGANPHYAWFTCDDAEGNNAVAIAGAADAASYAIPTPVATQYYKVVVTTDCGSVSAVALVTLLPDIVPLADVTESTVWDWSVVTKVADGSDLSGNGPTVTTGNGLVIANYLQGDNFDKIEGNNGAYSIRSSSNKFYQGASLHMHTTKGGILTIRARNEGHEMTLNVENEGRDIELGNLGNWKNYTIYVKAGDVTIYNVPAESTYPMRVEKITFTVKETPDYWRNVSNNIGTLCVDHNVVVGGALGATFYQIAGRNATYPDKIDFDEVAPNEVLKAGEPYIFQSTTGKIDLFYAEGDAVTDSVVVNGMHGVLVGGNLEITEDNMMNVYYISENKLRDCSNLVSSGLTLVANRAYIVMNEVDAAPSQPAPGRRRMTIGGGNAPAITTGIDALNAGEAPVKVLINGQIFILRGEKMYDATGRLVK